MKDCDFKTGATLTANINTSRQKQSHHGLAMHELERDTHSLT